MIETGNQQKRPPRQPRQEGLSANRPQRQPRCEGLSANRPQRQPRCEGLYDARNEHDACGIGAVANISGEKSHAILEHANQVILNLHHRGAAGADDITGDGAGILFQIPDDFFQAICPKQGIDLPKEQPYGVGMLFTPRDAQLRQRCEELFAEAVAHYGLTVLGWRDVPSNNSSLGEIALQAEPITRQVFLDGRGISAERLELNLYLARERASKSVRRAYGEAAEDFYVCSMSSRTILYKGMFMAHQLFEYFPDLHDKRMKSALASSESWMARYNSARSYEESLAEPSRRRWALRPRSIARASRTSSSAVRRVMAILRVISFVIRMPMLRSLCSAKSRHI